MSGLFTSGRVRTRIGPMESSDYLIELFQMKQEQNPRFSLRAISAKTGVSAATLSQVMNKKMRLTLKIVERLSENLNLKTSQKDLLTLLVIKDSIQSDWLKDEVEKKILAIQNSPTGEELKDIHHLRESFSKKKIAAYFSKEHDCLRTLNTYPGFTEKGLGFSENIVCARKGVSSEVYFVAQQGGRYAAYVSLLDGSSVYRDQIQFSSNKSLSVQWSGGYPQIYSACMPLIGQSRYALANILYSEDKVLIEGESFSYSGEECNQTFLREHVRIS